jgi:hypothetical protein
MRSWYRSSVAAALAAVVSAGFLSCPCETEDAEHGGCSKAETAIGAVRGDCCDGAVPAGVVASASTAAPLVLSIATAALEVTAPASAVHFRASHRLTLQAQPLVLRI